MKAREIEIMWAFLCRLYKERMEESGLGLLKYISHQELLSLIELVNIDHLLSDNLKVLATRALLQRDTGDAKALIAGRIP